MELNKVHHLDWLENGLPDKSVQLIIADPPYFEIKGEFDFIWSSFDEYLKDVEEWAKECKRILADNGTLFWYGDDKRIAYAQVIFDKHFSLVNSLVWYKYNLRGGMFGSTGGDGVRSFPICTERVLMYSNEVNQTGLERIKLDINNFTNLRNYFKELQTFIGLGLKKINDQLGHRKAEHAFYWKSTQWELPTPETYNELNESYAIASWSGFREYEDLRREYEDLRRPFENIYNLNEVLQFNTNMDKSFNHDTVKPEKLTRALILTCSRPNDLVFVPFAGSGTECAMAAKEGRQFIGFDINATYVDMANKRAQTHLSTPTLF
jgi:site-specific DNA-methyltransferase (adenine-specific)